MIKYSGNTINDWNYGASNLIKVYRNGAVCYYKVTGGGDVPTAQTPCYAVVDDISQYSDTEFEDVFNLADEKWYKLNNLSQYEEYGIYGSGRTITTYEGKLTIDGDYEYQYSGSSWVNVGQVSGSSRLPQGYTEVEYIESNGTQYINTNAYITNTANFEVGYTIIGKSHQWGYVHQNVAKGAWVAVEGNNAYFGRWNSNYWVDISNQITTGNNTIVYKSNSGITVNETFNAKTLSLTSTDNITTIPLHIFGWWDFYNSGVEMQQITQRYKSFYLKVNGVLIRDLVPAKRDSDNKYGMYDIVNDVFYLSPNNVDFSGGEPIAPTEYPKYYDEMQDPPDNLVFSTMAEADAYECPWVGMHATIAGDSYIFSGDSQSGYEWVEIT